MLDSLNLRTKAMPSSNSLTSMIVGLMKAKTGLKDK